MRLPPDLLPSILLGAYPALYVSTIVHEAGHALLGRLAGFRVTSFGAGTERPFLVWRLPGRAPRALRTVFYLCRGLPFQGIAWAYTSDTFPARSASAVFLLGGPLANLLLATVSLALWRLTHASPLLVLGALNVSLGLGNLFPHSMGLNRGGTVTLRSDGAQILGLMRRRTHRRAQAPSGLVAMRPLWVAVGDRRLPAVQGFGAALAALDFGAVGLARRLHSDTLTGADAEAMALPEVQAPRLLAEAHLAAEEGRWADAAECAAGSRRAYAAAGGEAGAVAAESLAAVARAHRDGLTADAVRAAQERLAGLAEGRTARRQPALRVALLECRIGLLAAAASAGAPPAPGALETLLARYESARYRCRIDTADLRAYSAAAGQRRREGDADGAWPLYERALTAAREVYDALAPDPEAQDRFVARMHRTLLPEAAECAREMDRPGDAALAASFLPDPAQQAERRVEAARRAAEAEQLRLQAEGRRLRLAWGVAGVNAALGAAALAFGASGLKLAGGALLLHLAAVLFTCLCLWAGRALTEGRTEVRNVGSILLAVALSGWLVGLGAVYLSR